MLKFVGRGQSWVNAYRYQQGVQRKRTEEQGYDDKSNEALRGLTEALKEASAAKGVLGTAGKVTTPTSTTATAKSGRSSATGTSVKKETPAPEGSLKYLNEKASDIKAKIDIEIDPDKRKQLVKDYDAVKAEIEQTEIACGLQTPKESEVKTKLEELKAQLTSKQAEFENAVTIEAKVQAACEVAKLQSEIDIATNGQLTIPATVEPEYIEKGSIADKRKSYSNAGSKASLVQSDFDAGLIDEDTARKQIAEINSELSQIGDGVKPFELQVDTKKAVNALDAIQSGWSGIKGVGNGIQSISDALSGNEDAWSAITGVMDGFLEIASGIQGIVGLINMLTGTTTAHTAAAASDASATAEQTVATTAQATAAATDAASTTADTTATVAHTAAATTDAVATQTDTVASTANTVAKSGQAIAGATASGASMPFPMNIVAIAMGVAAVVAALSTAFATGGVVGGTSTSGDKKFVRVNSGEMILNKFQQANLYSLINSGLEVATPKVSEISHQPITLNTNALASSLYTPSDMVGNVNFKISGRDLVGSVSNTTRLGSKSGKKSNIKI